MKNFTSLSFGVRVVTTVTYFTPNYHSKLLRTEEEISNFQKIVAVGNNESERPLDPWNLADDQFKYLLWQL